MAKDYQKRLAEWNKLEPVYFHKWMWLYACDKNSKYDKKFPEYQGKRVVLT